MDLKLDQALRLAKKKVAVGSVEEARLLYNQILKKFPNNKKAKNSLRNLSPASINKSVSPQEPPRHQLQQLIDLYGRGQHQFALDNTLKLQKKFPNSPTLHNISGAIYAAFKRYDEAIKSYKRALIYNPTLADAHFNIGVAQKECGDLIASVISFERALHIKPNYPEAHANMANVMAAMGELDDAIYHYNLALKIGPDNFEICFNLGNVHVKKGELDAAIDCYKQALKIKPDYAEAYSNMGDAFRKQGEQDRSIDCYELAIKIKPNYAEAHYNIGILLEQKGERGAAINTYRQAIRFKPDYAEAHNQMGVSFQGAGEFEAAIECFKQALQIYPLYAEAHSNIGFCLSEKGHLEAAISSYQQAIKINPDYADAHRNLGIAFLTNERFEEGFKLNEWRWKSGQIVGKPLITSKPLWSGEEGQAVFVWKEQGIGDEIMFASIIPELHALCSKLIVQCDERLIPLFQRSFPRDITYQSDSSLVTENLYDFHIPIGSLPRFFRTSSESFSKTSGGYLCHDTTRSNQLRQKLLMEGKKRLIGISWMTTSSNQNSNKRNISLSTLARALDGTKTQLVCLQYGDVFEEIDVLKTEFGIDIIQFSEINNRDDIDDLASLIMACDEIVSTTNATVHLAGALGADVKVLLPFRSRWIWGRDQSRSYWYSTVTPYSQAVSGNWDNVLDFLVKDMKIDD